MPTDLSKITNNFEMHGGPRRPQTRRLTREPVFPNHTADPDSTTAGTASIPVFESLLEAAVRSSISCRDLGFEVLHSPAREGESPLAAFLRAERAGEYLAGLPFDASPVDDDRPFFYYLLRPADFFAGGARRAPDFDDRGLLVMRNLLVTVLVLVVLCILVPLWRHGRAGVLRRGRSLAAVAFFAALGLGFLVVEIGLLKRFLLLLGKPVYTLAVTLAVFLAAGAVGSAHAGRIAGRAGLLRRRCGVLAIVLMLAAALLPALLEGLLAAPLWASGWPRPWP